VDRLAAENAKNRPSLPIFRLMARERMPWLLGSAAVAAIGLAFVYWPIIVARFAVVSSDNFDGLIMVSLLEHWFGVLRGRETPLTPIYFHPFRTTLAYNDGNLISGILYSIPRTLGLDPFLSYELTNWTVRVVGCLSTIALTRLVLRLGLGPSLAAGFLTITVTSLSLHMGHAQLLFAAFVPLGLLLFAATFDLLSRPDTSNWTCYAAVTGFAIFVFSWAMTAFYSLYVFVMLLGLAFCLGQVLLPEVRAKALVIVSQRWAVVVWAAVMLAASVRAVFWVYSRARATGHDVEALQHCAGRWVDIANVGTGNF
jgi:hypothetical protein